MKLDRILTVMNEAAREPTDELRVADVATVSVESEGE